MRTAPRLRWFSLSLLALLLPAVASAREPKEQARIDFLIQGVETSSGLTFIRNGTAHDGAAAGKHLRIKLDLAGDRVETAEQFIKYCASESLVTHRKYEVRMADGATTDAAAYFTERLREFDRSKR